MLTDRAMSGFTMVELLVALTIAGFLLAIGVPAMSTYLQSAKVGSATQSLHSGLQTARTEAIRRNQLVEFVMTNSSVAASGVADSVVAAAAGVNWLVRAPAASGPGFDLIDAKAATEASAGAPSSVVIAASGAFGGTVTFNGFGGVTSPAGFAFTIRHASAATCPAAGPIRCRLVRVSGGGQVSSCDPAIVDVTDSRYCN